MGCLFCNGQEPNCNHGSDVDFICSRCVQLLLEADQNDLRKAHVKAIEKGYSGKAKAIESFLIKDEYNVRETKKSKRNLERKRPLRKVRLASH